MARRIGLLTFHHIVNEGAVLQTYALMRRLQALFPGDEVEVIDCRSRSAQKGYFLQTFAATRKPRALLGNASRFLRTRSFIRQQLRLSRRSIETDDYGEALAFVRAGRYDLIVVGSDEIWKIENGVFARPFPNIYWLGEGIGCAKVAYAASANKLEYRELSEDRRRWMVEALGRFDLIGVRDDHTMGMLRHLGVGEERGAHKVPDPTFLLKLPEAGLEAKLSRLGIDLERPIVGITFDIDGISEPLLQRFRSMGFQSVAVTAFNRHADFNLAGSLSPLEWATVFRHFSFTFTTLFHGSIFSLKNDCPFLSVDLFSGGRYETKLQCLLRDLGLMERYVPFRGNQVTAGDLLAAYHRVSASHDRDRLRAVQEDRRKEADRFLGLVGALA